MFRGVVLRVAPSEHDLEQLPFQYDRSRVSNFCRTDSQKKSQNTGCICGCCCFSFELSDAEEAIKVPATLWGKPVVWRKTPNPIGIDQCLPEDFDKRRCNGSRIPNFDQAAFHKLKYSKKEGDILEHTISVTKKTLLETKEQNYDIFLEEKNTGIVVMGAGGIGCEVLKTLFLRGFHNFTVLDRDTIDVTNLNRQLLFSSRDVGRSKAETSITVLKHAFQRSPFYKSLHDDCTEGELESIAQQNMQYFHGDIETFCEKANSLPRFSQYAKELSPLEQDVLSSKNLCYSALDNIPTRRFINKLCCEAAIPAIETGVSGQNGQVQPICTLCGSQCYDCQGVKRPDQQNSFAVCTIHAKPTKVVHCVHYAQQLHAFLTDSRLVKGDSENHEKSEFDELRALIHGTNGDSKEALHIAQALFDFMCADRIIEKFEDSEGNAKRLSQRRKRSRSPLPEVSNKPFPITFVQKLRSCVDLANGADSHLPAEKHQEALALVLFVDSLVRIMHNSNGDDQALTSKRREANFIFAVTVFRCMVFRISIEKQGDFSGCPEVFQHLHTIFDAVQAGGTSKPRAQALRNSIGLFVQSYGYYSNPMYMHIESIAMRIIPSLASANAILSAYAVSMGTRVLLHRHIPEYTFYANGAKFPIPKSDSSRDSGSFCENKVLRHIYLRAVPIQSRITGTISPSSGKPVENEGLGKEKKRCRRTISQSIFSHPPFRLNPKCCTCAQLVSSIEKTPQKKFELLANCEQLPVRSLIECIVNRFLDIQDPILDMEVPPLVSSGKEVSYRTLFEHDEFEQNSEVPLSKWVSKTASPMIVLIVGSVDNMKVKTRLTVFHDAKRKLEENTMVLLEQKM